LDFSRVKQKYARDRGAVSVLGVQLANGTHAAASHVSIGVEFSQPLRFKFSPFCEALISGTFCSFFHRTKRCKSKERTSK